MKRSRLFLGLTTCFLAIAGVVAAKANHFGQSHAVRYFNVSGICVTGASSCVTSSIATVTCVTNAGALVKKPFYTYNTTANSCAHIIKYTQL